MTDHRLRTLERRWKESGAVEDEATYLLERVRIGAVTQEGLKLAAYLGDEGARALVPADEGGWQCHCDTDQDTSEDEACSDCDLACLLHLLPRWGRETLVRVAVAGAWVALASEDWSTCCDGSECTCRGMPIDPEWYEARRAIEAAETWIVDPSEENREAVLLTAHRLGEQRTFSDAPYLAIFNDWNQACMALSQDDQSAAHLASESCIRTAIQRDLVPWALAEGDPARRRVDERSRA